MCDVIPKWDPISPSSAAHEVTNGVKLINVTVHRLSDRTDKSTRLLTNVIVLVIDVLWSFLSIT